MTESADRYRRVSAAFTGRVVNVPADAWDRPAPCEGWVARDVAMDEMLRTSGHYGPRVPVVPDADEQTRLLAFLGRQP